MMAAPAEVPATTPPRCCSSRIAASSGDSTPPGRSVSTMRPWSPPVKNTPCAARTLSTSTGSRTASRRSTSFNSGATRRCSATAPCAASAAIVPLAAASGSPEAVARTTKRAPGPPASSTSRDQTAALSSRRAPPMATAGPVATLTGARRRTSATASASASRARTNPMHACAAAARTGRHASEKARWHERVGPERLAASADPCAEPSDSCCVMRLPTVCLPCCALIFIATVVPLPRRCRATERCRWSILAVDDRLMEQRTDAHGCERTRPAQHSNILRDAMTPRCMDPSD